MLLRSVLQEFGADFNPEKEGYSKLSQPTNKYRRPGMDAVWGKDFMDNYNTWTEKWADAYESKGKSLPRLGKSKKRTSGMKHFLGLITAYAAEQIDFEEFREQMEVRLIGGFTYARGMGKVPSNILAEGKKYAASIPPGFAKSAWEVIKSGGLRTGVPDVEIHTFG